MGVLTKAQYLSANSGGGWVTTPYSYSSAAALANFFGPYVDPTNLTVSSLSKQHTAGSWGKAASDQTLVPGLLSNPGKHAGSHGLQLPRTCRSSCNTIEVVQFDWAVCSRLHGRTACRTSSCCRGRSLR